MKVTPEFIKEALKKASGKSMHEASAIVADAVNSFLAAEDSFSVAEEYPMPPPIVAVPQEATPPRPVPGGLRELKPVATATTQDKPQVARKMRTIEDIQAILMDEAPPVIEVIPDGWVDTLTLERMITNDSQAGSVQLAYRPRKMEQGVPYPKVYYWTTDTDTPNIEESLGKMREDAVKLFRLRKGPITTRVADMGPLSTRMNNGGSV